MTVNLVPEWIVGDISLTSSPYSVDADSTVEVGEPEMVVETVTSQLADGELERVVRHGNRTYVIPVYIEGHSLGELAEAEAALRAELKRPGLTLTHDPGDSLSPASRYQVYTAQMTFAREDRLESHLIRKFTISLKCGPWASSVTAVTVDAVAAVTTPTTVSVTNADTVTGWSATYADYSVSRTVYPVTVVDGGAFVKVTASGYWLDLSLRYAMTAVGMASTPYLVIEAGEVPGQAFRLILDGVETSMTPSLVRATGNGTSLYAFDCGAKSLSGIRVGVSLKSSQVQTRTLSVHNVYRTDEIPYASLHQKARVLEVGGTERTPGSIHVQTPNGTTPLFQTVVHTCPEDGSGYAPPLRRWRVAGQGGISSPGSFSGAYEVITGLGITFDTPTSALPEGGYSLVAYMRAVTAGTVDLAWSTSTIFPNGTTEQGFTNGVEKITFATAGWQIVHIATLSLPSVRTKQGKVRTILQVPSGIEVWVDEAWLFRIDDDCALTIVDTGYPNLWLNSPGVDAPVSTVWVGDAETTRVHPGTGLQAMGTHILSPGGTAVFTASLSDNPETDATFNRLWHSNAAS